LSPTTYRVDVFILLSTRLAKLSFHSDLANLRRTSRNICLVIEPLFFENIDITIQEFQAGVALDDKLLLELLQLSENDDKASLNNRASYVREIRIHSTRPSTCLPVWPLGMAEISEESPPSPPSPPKNQALNKRISNFVRGRYRKLLGGAKVTKDSAVSPNSDQQPAPEPQHRTISGYLGLIAKLTSVTSARYVYSIGFELHTKGD